MSPENLKEFKNHYDSKMEKLQTRLGDYQKKRDGGRGTRKRGTGEMNGNRRTLGLGS